MHRSSLTLDGDRTIGADDREGAGPHFDHLKRGDSVGRYLLLGLLGRGGMGEVYAAHDPELDRTVALKVVRQPISGDADIRTEAKALARLSHPNIVTVHDVGEISGGLFIAMDHVDGKTLRVWANETSRSWDEVATVLLAAGRGLAAAHREGLMHLDFKPDNVMLDGQGRVVVLDFGLAQAVEAGAEPGSVALRGTPAYMAPEQHRFDEIDARADQFAFCVTWLESAFGKRPFPGRTPHAITAAILDAHYDIPPRPPGVSRVSYAAILRGLSKDPADRWPSMDALLEAVTPPTSRLRRTGAAVIGAAGVGALVTWAVAAPTTTDCSDAGANVARAWSADDRPALRTALETQELEGPAIDRAIRRLDQYGARLVEGYVDACQAKPPVPEQRACLDIRLEQLRASRDVITSSVNSGSDATALEPLQVRRILGGLQDTHSCRLAQDDPLYAAVASAAGAPEVLRQLATGSALSAAGRVEQADAILAEVLAASKDAGWQGVEALARLEVAAQLARAGDHDGWRAEIERALDLSAKSRSDQVTSSVLLALLGEHGLRGNVDAVLALAPVAKAAAVRAGADGRGTIDIALGNAYQLKGMYAQAQLAYEDALDSGIQEETRPTVEANLGAITLVRGEYTKARVIYTSLLQSEESVAAPSSLQTLENKTNLADAHQQLGDYATARTLYEEVLAAHAAEGGTQSRAARHVRLNLSYALVGLGLLEQATQMGMRAAEEIRAAHGRTHVYAFSAADLISTLAFYRGDMDSARANTEELLGAMADVLGPNTELSAGPLLLLAKCNFAAGDTKAALVHVQQATERFARLNPHHPSLVRSLELRARVLQDLGRTEEAVKAARDAVSQAQAASVNPLDRGLAELTLSELLRAQGGAHGGAVEDADTLDKSARETLEPFSRHPDVLEALTRLR